MRTENNSDLPSFSVSQFDSQDDENFTFNSEVVQRFLQENMDLSRIISLLSYNQTYLELLDKLVDSIDLAIQQNRTLQATIRNKLNSYSSAANIPAKLLRAQIHLPCWPPYFKDRIGMAPNMNSEAQKILRICLSDPLVEEDKKWNPRECEQLCISVCQSLKDEQIYRMDSKKEVIFKKLRAAGIETTNEQKQNWRNEIEWINKRIAFIRARPMDEFISQFDDYSDVDWAKVSARDFQGTRSVVQLRQKWINEMCPHYNNKKWTFEEDERLACLGRDMSNWNEIAEKLGTNRSAFKCFERFAYFQQLEREPKPWTPGEDHKLRELIRLHKVGEEIPWAKISIYMDGRTKLSCEYRYTRSISEKLRHGRWTKAEDMILLEAINKYGPQNWSKISQSVKGRSALQCRDRWVHVLDHKHRDLPWSWEEHQRLLYGIRLFGRDECAKIAKLLPGRNNMDVRMRIRLLLKYLIEQQQPNQADKKKVIYRHFANNYLYCKTRRRNVVEEFSKYIEQKQIDRKHQLIARLGLGSFVTEPSTGVNLNYTTVKIERSNQFNQWQIFGSGRWVKAHYKNPNEYDRENLLTELDNLPEDIRIQTINWLEESDRKLKAEREQEKEIPDDQEEAKMFYDQMYPPERFDDLFAEIAELIPPRESDMRYYIMYKMRPAKIRIKKELMVNNIKKERLGKLRKKKTKLVKLFENIDKLHEANLEGMRWYDRMMVETYKEIEAKPKEEQRQFLIMKLCDVVRHRLHHIVISGYKINRDLEMTIFDPMCDYIKKIVDSEKTFPKKDESSSLNKAVILPPNWENMTMKELVKLKLSPEILSLLVRQASGSEESLTIANRKRTHKLKEVHGLKQTVIMPIGGNSFKKYEAIKKARLEPEIFEPLSMILKILLPPCTATLNAMDLYDYKVRDQLIKGVHLSRYLKDLANENEIEASLQEIPGTSTQININIQEKDLSMLDSNSLITDKMRTSIEYLQFRRRMYRLFFLPMIMIRALKEGKQHVKTNII